ncbi:MAG: metallophosphoesterase, partial [Trueperaceae bacterium]
MRLLLTGDLHIGRTSTRVPSELPQSDRSAAGAWNRIVRLATEEACDVVCLSGDVADQSNKFWEAIGPLEAGVTTLAEAGIQVVAVTGNHDHDVLPRLADQLPDGLLTLLGRGGRWERTTLEGDDGRPSLHLDGWSFPKARVTDDPLAAYDLPHDGAVPTLGLVHGDLDLSTSPYAPLSRERLRRAAPDAWLLGHVHVPGLHDLDAGGWALYPGSPQAQDPGEPGPPGP